ncbi:MAG: acyl carrier protein [Ruminococcus sp.]
MTFDKIKDLIVDQLDVEESKVTMDTNIQDDLGADSLDIVDLIMAVEDEFEVKIEDEEVENLKTVGDIVNYIDNNN